MTNQEFTHLLRTNNGNEDKLLIWDSINLSIYPLYFVCSEKRKNKVNKYMNKLALEDMPEIFNINNDINIDLLYKQNEILLDNYNDFKNQMRILAGATPRVIARYLDIAIKSLINILNIINSKRSINHNIYNLIILLLEIIKLEYNDFKDKYNM